MRRKYVVSVEEDFDVSVEKYVALLEMLSDVPKTSE